MKIPPSFLSAPMFPKLNFFSTGIEFDQSHPLEFLSLSISNLNPKNFFDVRTRVITELDYFLWNWIECFIKAGEWNFSVGSYFCQINKFVNFWSSDELSRGQIPNFTVVSEYACDQIRCGRWGMNSMINFVWSDTFWWTLKFIYIPCWHFYFCMQWQESENDISRKIHV